ncbi:hypothetical protein F9U64_14695 [Gracilibacillus oryzae]|uniref:Uncharacterized protein n=1 Tax=Gracilibacillus oryzae TaxID=1672701 RepID=A0A7C8GRT6_9BACI|nr:hypothetical protein [Gracilibacillus oryzae]KAB8129886.1 hypothetical protein F9U64_14695 [Gracilibacillus oryzae]
MDTYQQIEQLLNNFYSLIEEINNSLRYNDEKVPLEKLHKITDDIIKQLKQLHIEYEKKVFHL